MGIELNVNQIMAVRDGYVTATGFLFMWGRRQPYGT